MTCSGEADHVVSFTELVLYIAIVHLTIKKNLFDGPGTVPGGSGRFVARGSPYEVPECQECCGRVREAPGGFPRHAPSPAATADNRERPEANQKLRLHTSFAT